MRKLLKLLVPVVSFGLTGLIARRRLARPRRGWERQFKLMAERGDDKLIEFPASSWDRDEWAWE